MKSTGKSGKERVIAMLAVALRLILGGIFVSGGIQKLGHLDAFYEAAQAYKILPPELTQVYAGWLPWLETLAGVCLLLGLFTRVAAGLAGTLLGTFLIALAVVLMRGDLIDCGCYPGAAQPTPVSWELWFRDLLMLAGAGLLIWNKNQPWSVDVWLKKHPDWKMIPVILIVLYGIVTGLVALSSKTPEKPPPPPVAQPLLPMGSMLPDFRLQELDGKTVSLSQFRGKKTVLVEIFATWCPHCQHSVPLLKQLQSTNPDRLQILAINAGDQPGAPSTSASFRMQYSITYPILENGSTQALISTYHVSGFPTFYLVDPSGRIIWEHSGSLRPQNFADLQAALKR